MLRYYLSCTTGHFYLIIPYYITCAIPHISYTTNLSFCDHHKSQMNMASLGIIILYILVLCKEFAFSATTYHSKLHSRNLVYDKTLEDYLTNFGYLPQSNLETGAMRTEQQLVDAVKNLQFFAGINVTGDIDQGTMDIMKKPRCGVPDITHTGIYDAI